MEQGLSMSKMDLLKKMLSEKGVGTATKISPQPREKDEVLRLSFSQQRLWFLDKFDAQSKAFNIPAMLKLKGNLNIVWLHTALSEIVSRHEILRTSFIDDGDEPLQVINPKIEIELSFSDISSQSEEEKNLTIEQTAKNLANVQFLLEKPPLLKFKLLKTANDEHWLILVMHHIISDGWSVGVLIREISELYTAFEENRAADLPKMPIQYADYAVWQRKLIENGEFDRQLNYWLEKLSGNLPVLELPTDQPRPKFQTHRGANLLFEFDEELTKHLNELSRKNSVTLFTVLIAGYKSLLYRYTNQNDILVGTSTAGRNYTETEPLIGFFLNSVVLRSNISPNFSFTELIKKISETTIKAFENQEIPVELLIEKLKPERNPGISPLFQTLFVMQNNPAPQLKIGSLKAEIVEVETESAKFDLSISAEEKNGKIILNLEYDTNLFEKNTIERFAEHYRNLMREVTHDPSAKISAIELFDNEARQKLLSLSKGNVEFTEFVPFPNIFAETAAKFPKAVAVKFENETLTYAELDKESNRLAALLLKKGIKSEDRIGIYFERSAEMIVSLLAVIKSGAVYVPLDPKLPQERISYIEKDASLAAVLTHRKIETNVTFYCQTLLWEEFTDLPKDEKTSDVSVKIDSENAAYLIYTSGSTGKPKAVVTRHQGFLNYIRTACQEFQLSDTDRFLQFASLSFDTSAEEIFPILASGGTLVIRTEEMLSTIDDFCRLCEDWKITVLDLPTAFWHQLVETITEENLRLPESLRLVIIGGEKANPATISKWNESVSEKIELFNTYGPTETTIVATSEFVSKSAKTSPASIGRAITNTRVYVLDEWMRVVPQGVVGELFIGGFGVARGYLNNFALTAEKFLPDPFAENSGARLYRTGDLVRWNKDGKLEFTGRADRQLKVRGYRIEPGEIETVLMQNASVKQAVVTAEGETLTAYLVKASAAEKIDYEDLREQLREKLPEYMRPQKIAEIETVPLTSNGKIDEKSLKRLDAVEIGRDSAEKTEMPKGETEIEISKIWSQLLGVEMIGRTENFFELGGHSLLVTKLLARIRNKFGAEVRLKEFFENPTIRAVGKLIEANRGKSNLDFAPKIEKAQKDAVIPLSFPQERVWFLCQLDPTNVAYNVPRAVRVKGNLDIKLVEKAFTEIFARHEILRTTFHVIDGQVRQNVHAPQPVTIQQIDLRGFAQNEKEKQTLDYIEREGNRIFDLEKLPLLRLSLLRQSDEEYVLFMVEHHLLHDGWTQGVLISDFIKIYEAFAQGKSSPLKPLSIQYGDFAFWQRNYLQGENLEKLLEFWRKTLEGAPELLQLPTTFPRPPIRSSRGGEVIWEIDEDLAFALRELSRKNSATLYMTMLAAFKILFYRYSGQSDIVAGSGVANRGIQEIENMIGMVVNTIPLRTIFTGDYSFEKLIGQMRETALEAFSHQDIPFEKLVEAINPPRSLAYTPIFQVLISFLNTPMQTMKISGLEFEMFDAHNKSAKFDLNVIIVSPEDQNIGLQAQAENKRLTVLVEYSTDLYDEKSVKEMVGHYENLLRSIVAEPKKSLGELEILDQREKLDLTELNRGKLHILEADADFVAAFEKQQELTPHKQAIVFGDEVLTYAELNQKANQLARLLLEKGAEPEKTIGLCLRRSPQMVIALLAVLKTGAAYIPLDPIYPKERIEYALQDAEAHLLITEKDFAKDFENSPTELFLLDEISVEDYSDENPKVSITAENSAYVIYTSGSTGKPKGVQITRRSLANFLEAMRERPQITAEDKLLAVTTVSFDIAVLEIFLPLTVGATVILASAEDAMNADNLKNLLENSKATICQATPATWQMLTANGWENKKLKVLCGGEAVSSELADELRNRSGEFWNMYGPTEATVWASCANLTEKENEITLGNPLPNTVFYVVDEKIQLVPKGVAGELLIGGDALARGYYNKPGLTAEKFIPNPFANNSGKRVYRTGDQVRILPNGEISFLGRIDNQIKLRGYRIELGEIESVLNSFAEIKRAVVSVHGDFDDKQLIAYLEVEKNAEKISESNLREYLEKHLPAYMIPSLFVFLNEFPLTPNGKIDRRALPIPAEIKRSAENRTAPQTETEKGLAEIWRELLKIRDIYREDNFFAIGGHSLLATRMVSQITEVFGTAISLRAIFEKNTLQRIANEIEFLSAQTEIPFIPRAKRNFGVKTPLSFSQKRLWFLQKLNPQSSANNIPYAVKLNGKIDIAALEKAIREVVARHEVLRSTFDEFEGEPVQIVDDNNFKLTIEDFTFDGGFEKAEDFAENEAERPFELEKEIPFRATLLKISENEAVLFLNIHHIAADGWSVAILVKEISTFYADLLNEKEFSIDAPKLQYSDYAVWQKDFLQDERFENQMSFWREELADAPPILELPTDFPRPSVQSGQGGGETFIFKREFVNELKEISRRNSVTVFMTLLAAITAVLSKYSGQKDILIGSPVAGRNQAEFENLIGCFINMLVLRLNTENDPKFSELLIQTKEKTLKAFENQDIPFESVIEEIQPERSLSHAPLFQVMLAYQLAPESRSVLPDIELEVLPLENKNSRGDLHFNFTESDGEIFGIIEYNSDIFAAESAANLAKLLKNLLDEVILNSELKLGSISLLNGLEKNKLISAPNQTKKLLNAGNIVESVTIQCGKNPSKTAIKFGNEHITYGELDSLSNIAAQNLMENGVKSGDFVALIAERSAKTVIALLGILKAGAAYLPLDAEYPNSRIDFLLTDSDAGFVIGNENHQNTFADKKSVFISLEDLLKSSETKSEINLPELNGEDAAYVIYTSGSTGQPKGVIATHKSVVRLTEADYLQISEDDIFLQYAPISFDASTFEIWTCLANGASLLIAPPEKMSSGELGKLIFEENVTVCWLTAGLFHLMIDEQTEKLKKLRYLIAGGDVLIPEKVRKAFEELNLTRFLNGYGPTETTTFACCHDIQADDFTGNSIPIGRAITNTRVYVLDEQMRIVPQGVVGELFIGGFGVARGYLNNFALTAEKFLPDPFAENSGARLYRTGDLVRWNKDGKLEFTGRADRQLKVRGYRIEPGEIETVLMQNDSVRQAVVTAEGETLTAYLVKASATEKIDYEDLREQLREKLPEYMRPQKIAEIETIPLTSNGKIDRAKLLNLEYQTKTGRVTDFKPPIDELEQKIAEIWSEMLKIEKIGRDDNFFEIGGHSLLAAGILSRINQSIGVNVQLRDVFAAPTIAALAEIIERNKTVFVKTETPIVRADRRKYIAGGEK